MKPISNSIHFYQIRLSRLLSLIFFAFPVISCHENAEEQLNLVWKDNKAVAITISTSLLKERDKDSLLKLVEVRLEYEGSPPIMGNYELEDDVVRFTPLIPLSRELPYVILYRNQFVGRILIPAADALEPPELTAVYPTNDTLPENLLKFYFQFSAPMRTGQSLSHIVLIDENNDTLRNTFLELQPELWNKDNSVLTLWLDPGRIKRDLIPNQKMGNPLIKGKQYKLLVTDDWKDVQNRNLRHKFEKQFIVTARDEKSPGPAHWDLRLPHSGSYESLTIMFNETLDYFLLQETIKLFDENGNEIKGGMKISEEEKILQFMPENPWKPGRYKIEVAPRLEDLAGNNLERLFDRDLKDSSFTVQKSERYFILQ